MSKESYESPLSGRYASREMQRIFSDQYKYSTWRRLWVILAKTQKELGLPISDQQILELESHTEDIDFSLVEQYESELQHDVMAHIHAYGDLCPSARPILHLGATSCYVTDNGDLIQMREGMKLLEDKLQKVIRQLSDFALQYKDLACLGFTHFQPAQLTTVGKRACLWIQELKLDLEELQYRIRNLKLRGAKGTTGTQASFLALFQGDHEKVKELDRLIAEKLDFPERFAITGQTYTRKQDSFVLNAIAGLAASTHKFATDLRLLANLKELEEPFGAKQIGSSAMPYKRNPMLSERICALARFVISLAQNPLYTSSTQWLERTLDDSANRRLALSEAFLTADAILNLMLKVTAGIVVNEKVIEKNIQEELPFMATENILMASVQKGGDRQDLHEKLRVHSHEAAYRVKQEGKENNLMERIANDPAFPLSASELQQLIQVTDFIGRAPEQVEEFLQEQGVLV